MDAQIAFAAAATVVAVAFALATLDRWHISRRRHEAAWTMALFLFAGAAGALWLGAGLGWNTLTFRAFFYLGAIANVPVLALGTIELLLGPGWGRRCARGVFAFCVFGAGVMAVAPIDSTIDPSRLPQGSELFGPLPRVLAVLGSSVGAIVIFVGAVVSIVRVVRSNAPGRLAIANLQIAAGTVVLSLGGLSNSLANDMTSFAVSLVLGITLIFGGFLTATIASPPKRLQSVPEIPKLSTGLAGVQGAEASAGAPDQPGSGFAGPG